MIGIHKIDTLDHILMLLSGDLNYDNVSQAKAQLKELLGENGKGPETYSLGAFGENGGVVLHISGHFDIVELVLEKEEAQEL